MVQVCRRSITKQAMLNESLQQYKEIFRVVKYNWDTVVQVSFFSLKSRQYADLDTQSVRQYLDGSRNDDVRPSGPRGPGDGGNGQGASGGADEWSGNSGVAKESGGTNGRGTGRVVGRAGPTVSKRGRGGRARTANAVTTQVPDSAMNDGK